MSTAQNGNHVKVHYTGKLTDGTVFDSSQGREPLAFTLGQGNMIPGFEKGVLGMAVGDTKTVNIQPEEAYGERRDDLLIKVPIDQVPADITPEIGMQLAVNQPDGRQVPVVIAEVNEIEITLDANHHLAGRELVFEIELVEVQ